MFWQTAFDSDPDQESLAARTFGAVWVANFLAALGMMAFLPFFPSYLRDHLGVAEGQVALWAGLCVGAAPMAAAVMGPIWGALGDRFGRKPMVLRALFGLSIFVGLMSTARTPEVLFLYRIGQGAFSGFLPPSVTLVSLSYPAGRSGRISGSLSAAMATGTIAGPLLGSLFRKAYDPSYLFLATAGLCALGGLLVLVFAREPEGFRAKATTARLHTIFPDIGRRLASMMQKPRLRLGLLFLFFVQFGIGATNPLLELYVEQLHPNWTVEQISDKTAWLFTVMAVCAMVTMPVWGRFGDRRGHGRVLLWAAALSGVGLCVSGFATVFWVLLGGRLILGLFSSGLAPAAFGLVSDVIPREEQGAANGAVFSARAFALGFASWVGGWLASVVGLRGLFFAGGVGLMVLTALSLKRLGGAPPASAEGEAGDAEPATSAGPVVTGATPREAGPDAQPGGGSTALKGGRAAR